MNDTDIFVIKDSFEALDRNKDGFLTRIEFYQLYLGLSFRPERLPVEQLYEQAGLSDEGALISLKDALRGLKKVSKVWGRASDLQ